MIKRPIQILAALFITLFRLTGVMVGGLLLLFPAIKGMAIGYIPLAVGAGCLLGLMALRHRLEGRLMCVSERAFLAAVTAFIVLMQAALILVFRSLPTFDGLFVYREAVTLVETGQMSELTYYAPGQIWYYALVFQVFGCSPLVAQLAQVPLMVGLALAVYGMSREQLPMPSARFVLILSAIYPGILTYVLVTPYYFYMYALMLVLIAWAWLRVLKDGRHWLGPAVWGGLAAGWGALTKATLLVAPLQAFFVWMIMGGAIARRRCWLALVCFTLIMGATMAPWIMRNDRVFGEPVLICTSGPLVFYSANNPESDGLYSSIPDTATIETADQMLAHMAWCNEMAWAFIREQPVQFMELVAAKLLFTWGTETTFVELINWDGEPLGWIDPAMRFGVQVGWSALVFAWALIAGRALFRRSPPTSLEVVAGIVVLSKILIYSVYEGGARHHLPAIPLLLPYLVASFDVWKSRITAKADSA